VSLGPNALLYLAFGFGCAGAAVFYLWIREPHETAERVAVPVERVTEV